MVNTDQEKQVFPLIFLHLEKAAGTTLRQIHKRQYGAENVHDYIQGPDAFKKIPAGVKVIQGHIQFSFFDQLPAPATWITILRDPVERIISAYNYALDTPDHFVHQYALTRTIDKFVADGMYIWGENAQMKYLCGETDLPFGKCRREHLDQALQHLQTHFSLAGVSERFDETLILLKRMLDWNMPFYIRENVSSKRVRREDLCAETITVLEDHHKFGRAVYNYALDRLETAMQQQDETFAAEVEVFKLMNPQARPYLKNWTKDTNFKDLEIQIAYDTVYRLWGEEKHEHAARVLNFLILKYPKSVDLKNLEAAKYYHIGEIESAKRQFKRLIEEYPTHPAPYTGYGELLWEMGQKQNAFSQFIKALKLDQYHRQTVISCGRAFAEFNLRQDAQILYESYLQKHPRDGEVIYLKNIAG